MHDLEELLCKAVPRLKKDDKKAQKLRDRLIKLGGSYWRKGPRRLKRLGVDPKRYRPLDADLDGDAFLQGAREALGDRGFVRFMAAVKKELVRKLAEKKGGAAPAPAPAQQAPPEALTLSDGGLVVPDDDDDLALPPDDDLALPPDDDLALPPDDAEDPGGVPELNLDALEVIGAGAATGPPLGVRFGDDGGGARDEDDSDPSLAADRALARYRRTGDVEELKRARSLYKRAHKDAKSPVAQGSARGGLAVTYLLEGALDKAKDQAKRALKDFPSEPQATAVLCRVKWPKEAERERIQASLRRAGEAVSSGDAATAKKAAKALERELPKEPFAALILLALACDSGKEVEKALAKAWKRYPASDAFADLQLGAELDGPIIRGCYEWFEGQVKEKKGDALIQTTKNLEDKSNLMAAAFQIPLGLARAALAGRQNLGKDAEQQLRIWIGHGIFHAQHYDHAAEVYGSARKLNRESDLLPEINKCDTQCGVRKRSFDKPGIKHRMGKFDGVGVAQYRKATAARLKRILDDVEGDRRKLDAREASIVAAILGDAARRKKLKARAKKAGQDDPFAQIEGLEGKLDGLDKKPEPEKKGGLFGRMKAAASKAIDKAKGAVAASKKKEAQKALGRSLRDRPSGGWKDAELDAFLDKVDKLEPRIEFLEEEAEKARYAAGRAGEL